MWVPPCCLVAQPFRAAGSPYNGGVKAVVTAAVVVLGLAAGAYWYYGQRQAALVQPDPREVVEDDWLEHLYSQNPKVAEEATRQLQALGVSALPEIRTALQDPASDIALKKLKV